MQSIIFKNFLWIINSIALLTLPLMCLIHTLDARYDPAAVSALLISCHCPFAIAHWQPRPLSPLLCLQLHLESPLHPQQTPPCLSWPVNDIIYNKMSSLFPWHTIWQSTKAEQIKALLIMSVRKY